MFSACGILKNTKVTVQNEPLSTLNLSQKRVLVVSYDTEQTREFMISLKNYVRETLKDRQIVAERINIRPNNTEDMTDFTKLISDFKPDYLLTIKVVNERSRKVKLIANSVKILRDITLDFNITSYDMTVNPTVLWKSQAIVKHLYQTEQIATVKKIARKLDFK